MNYNSLTGEEFRAWATGKISEDKINWLIGFMNGHELWQYKEDWVE